MKEKIKNAKWYPYAVALCIAVVLYVILTHLGPVLGAVKVFLGYFASILLGCVLAYLLNPLAKCYERKVFKKVRKESLHWTLSIVLTVLTLVLFLVLLLGTLIPQLVDSITMLIENMDDYLGSLQRMTDRLGISEMLKLDQLVDASGSIVNQVMSVLKDNIEAILTVSLSAGKGLIKWAIALIMSIYMLAAKSSLKEGAKRLTHALMPEKRYQNTIAFFTRCDKILSQYIVYSLLDALIVGVANAVFMACVGMQYVGLVSLVVAVTNLIPTFGPIIGYVVGGFVLLLVNPMHALLFLIFAFILQFLDGYVIKPKLFGNSLGVSGLLILAAVIVFGNMFGIVGMLFAIPVAAILDFIYREAFLPALEKKREKISGGTKE